MKLGLNLGLHDHQKKSDGIPYTILERQKAVTDFMDDEKPMTPQEARAWLTDAIRDVRDPEVDLIFVSQPASWRPDAKKTEAVKAFTHIYSPDASLIDKLTRKGLIQSSETAFEIGTMRDLSDKEPGIASSLRRVVVFDFLRLCRQSNITPQLFAFVDKRNEPSIRSILASGFNNTGIRVLYNDKETIPSLVFRLSRHSLMKKLRMSDPKSIQFGQAMGL